MCAKTLIYKDKTTAHIGPFILPNIGIWGSIRLRVSTAAVIVDQTLARGHQCEVVAPMRRSA